MDHIKGAAEQVYSCTGIHCYLLIPVFSIQTTVYLLVPHPLQKKNVMNPLIWNHISISHYIAYRLIRFPLSLGLLYDKSSLLQSFHLYCKTQLLLLYFIMYNFFSSFFSSCHISSCITSFSTNYLKYSRTGQCGSCGWGVIP